MEPPGELVVATFNIHHGEGRDGVVDLGRTADTISSLGADLVALQELDREVSRSGRVDQALELASLTGMEVRFFPALMVERGEYGLALAAKGDFQASVEPLPRLAEERRIAIVARYRGVSIIATHLATGGRARQLQTEFVATLAGRLDPPVVILGDLNQPIAGLGPLVSAGFTTHPPPDSWRARLSFRRVDHIFVGPGLRIRNLRAVATDASDHGAVRARVIPRRGK